jgi:hypothetical protein
MIVLVPNRTASPRGPVAAWPFEIEHRLRPLDPGSTLEEALRRPGERHLHAVSIAQPVLATASLVPLEGFELALLEASYAARQNPANPLQALLEPGLYWLQVRAPHSAGGKGGAYRLRLHCVPL